MASDAADQRMPVGGERLTGVVRALLEHALDSLAASVTVTDASGRVVYANPAALELTAMESVESLLATPLQAVVERFLILDPAGSVVAAGDVPSLRVAAGHRDADERLLRVVHRDSGAERWRLVRAKALLDEDGRRFAVTVTEDVTAVKEAEARQAFIARAWEELSASLDYGRTLQRVARLAVPALADWCGVDVLDDRGLRRQLAVVHQDEAKVELARALNAEYPPDPALDTGVHGVLRDGLPRLYPRIPEELLRDVAVDARHLEILQSLGMRSVMIVPMKVRGRTIGALTLVSAESLREFDDDDLAFATELARNAAIAVENARLYTSRDEAAMTLQKSLLPDDLHLPDGWTAAHSYRPGDYVNEVGGDFYDVVELGDGSWLAFVGDVTGKGVRAAALTSLARHTLRAGARFDPSPRALMHLLEDVVNSRADAAPITVACVRGVPHPEGARLTVTCAGHPPPLLLRPGAAPELVGLPDVLLGAGVGDGWREVEVTVAPGDTLLLYTDGVTDTPGAASRFGEERLLEIAGRGPLEPERLLARVEAALAAWQSGLALDDRAMLALQLAVAVEGMRMPALAGGSRAV